MNKLWWEQIKAVVRLEMKKTFFAKRGLWIYVVALLPILIFAGYTGVSSHQQKRRAEIAQQGEKHLAYQDLLAIQQGMTKEDVVRVLGKPPVAFHWNAEREEEGGSRTSVFREDYHYSDGQNDLYISLSDGKVDSTHLEEGYNLGNDTVLFAGVFQFFFLRLAVFFGCLGIFMNLFRGEILDHSLHFYFLAPVRREVLTAGKFLAGLVATCVIFVTSELLQNVIFWWHFPGPLRDLYLYHNHGLEYALAYLGITILACIGYGSFFLICGMLFRNPILPTAGILLWEAANPFLPSVLKQCSVIYYLKALCPVDIPVPPDTPPLLSLLISNADPVSAPVAILGLLSIAALALYLSGRRVRRLEINYTTE